MNKPKILFLVEGAKTDVRLMQKLLSIYGFDQKYEIISYNTNIYTLYNEMFRDNDPADLDLLQVLKEHEKDPRKKPLFDQSYSDILLIFDLDPQDPLFTSDTAYDRIFCRIVRYGQAVSELSHGRSLLPYA